MVAKLILVFSKALRAKFTAKVALAAGYFIFGNSFIQNVAISELRFLMHYKKKYDKSDLMKLSLKGWFWPLPSLEKDLIELEIYVRMAKHINRSFVAIVSRYNPNDILIIVGILGNLVGVIRCPAESDKFPSTEKLDLGQVVILEKDFLRRISYRNLLLEISTSLLNLK